MRSIDGTSREKRLSSRCFFLGKGRWGALVIVLRLIKNLAGGVRNA